MKAGGLSLLGFIIGAGLGFAWGQATKKQIPNRVKTEFKNGVVIIEADVKGAAKDGLLSLFG